MLTDHRDYKRDEQRASGKVKEYFRDEEEWENSRHSTAYLTPTCMLPIQVREPK